MNFNKLHMVEVLYRKYRAQDFELIFGQEPIKKILMYAVNNNTFAHAYLFAGPRGTGKTSMARILAKAINCVNLKKGNPCNDCHSCTSITSNSALDVIEIDAASNRGIEEIRELRQNVNFAPASLKYKIYIIDEVHMLTKEAFNALLKTLEEPPSHVVFILATTEIQKVPITVISRTQRFDFKLASIEEIIKKIDYILESEKKKLADDAKELVASLGNGSFRDTETLLEKVLNSVQKKEIQIRDVEEVLGLTSSELINQFLDNLLNMDTKKTMLILSEIEKSGVNINYFFSQILESLRKKLLKEVISSQGKYKVREMVKIISKLIEAHTKIKFSPLEILPLELAVIDILSINPAGKSISEASKKEDEKKEDKEVEPKIVKNTKKDDSRGKSKMKTESAVSLEEVISKWKEVLEKMKPFNHHLVAFLKKGKPDRVEEDILVLKVGYIFHKQRIEQNKSREAFRKVTTEIFGVPFLVKCEIDEKLKGSTKAEDYKTESNETVVEELFEEG